MRRGNLRCFQVSSSFTSYARLAEWLRVFESSRIEQFRYSSNMLGNDDEDVFGAVEIFHNMKHRSDFNFRRECV